MSKQLKVKSAADVILGGKIGDDSYIGSKKDAALYVKMKKMKTKKKEKIQVSNPITGKSTEVMLIREGTTDKALGHVLLDKKTSQQKKDSMLAAYLFERGRESASFIAELMVSKGEHTKQTHAFKKQMRFDFEDFANTYCVSMHDLANGIQHDVDSVLPYEKMFTNIADRFRSAANTMSDRIELIKNARKAEKGFGIYVDKNGKAYSVLDEGIEEIIKKDKEEANKEVNE